MIVLIPPSQFLFTFYGGFAMRTLSTLCSRSVMFFGSYTRWNWERSDGRERSFVTEGCVWIYLTCWMLGLRSTMRWDEIVITLQLIFFSRLASTRLVSCRRFWWLYFHPDESMWWHVRWGKKVRSYYWEFTMCIFSCLAEPVNFEAKIERREEVEMACTKTLVGNTALVFINSCSPIHSQSD